MSIRVLKKPSIPEPRLLGDMDTEMHELDLDAPMNADGM
jgi:hypothetical protein